MTENRLDRKLKVIYSLSGRDEKARSEAGEVLRIHPKFSLNRYEKRVRYQNEAPRSKLRGIKAELRRSLYPPSLYRASARFTLPFNPAASSRVFRRRRIKRIRIAILVLCERPG